MIELLYGRKLLNLRDLTHSSTISLPLVYRITEIIFGFLVLVGTGRHQ